MDGLCTFYFRVCLMKKISTPTSSRCFGLIKRYRSTIPYPYEWTFSLFVVFHVGVHPFPIHHAKQHKLACRVLACCITPVNQSTNQPIYEFDCSSFHNKLIYSNVCSFTFCKFQRYYVCFVIVINIKYLC